MSRTRSILSLLAITGLAGCEMEATIKVAGNGLQPRFDVTYDRGKTACIRGLTLTDVTGAARRDIWAVRRTDAATAMCTGTMTFGVLPPGYEAVKLGGVLVPGRRYEVSALGVGWHAKAPVAVR